MNNRPYTKFDEPIQKIVAGIPSTMNCLSQGETVWVIGKDANGAFAVSHDEKATEPEMFVAQQFLR